MGKPIKVDTDQLPEGHELGGMDPVIESREDLEKAVATIRLLSSWRTSIDEHLTQQTTPLIDAANEQKQLSIQGVSVSFEEREKALRAAVADHIIKHKRTLFEDDSKTLRLQHGEVSMRDTPPAITFGRSTKAKTAAMLAEKLNVIGRLVTFASRLKVRPWLKFKSELDVTAIKKALEAKEVTPEQLADYGMRYGSTIVVDVKPYA